MTVIVKPSTPVRDIPDFALDEVVVRLARPDEHSEWDRLMDEHHYLGFRQFAGRGLRYIAEWRGQWLALLGWQTGVFQCAPRDEWLGWHRAVQMRRLHLIANNTRFLILPAGADVPNLARACWGPTCNGSAPTGKPRGGIRCCWRRRSSRCGCTGARCTGRRTGSRWG